MKASEQIIAWSREWKARNWCLRDDPEAVADLVLTPGDAVFGLLKYIDELEERVRRLEAKESEMR
jgi:hypothetical protein